VNSNGATADINYRPVFCTAMVNNIQGQVPTIISSAKYQPTEIIIQIVDILLIGYFM